MSEHPCWQIQEHQASEQEGFQPQPLASQHPWVWKSLCLTKQHKPCHLQKEGLQHCSQECPGQQMTL